MIEIKALVQPVRRIQSKRKGYIAFINRKMGERFYRYGGKMDVSPLKEIRKFETLL